MPSKTAEMQRKGRRLRNLDSRLERYYSLSQILFVANEMKLDDEGMIKVAEEVQRRINNGCVFIEVGAFEKLVSSI